MARKKRLPRPVTDADPLPAPELTKEEREELETEGYIEDDTVEYGGAFDSP